MFFTVSDSWEIWEEDDEKQGGGRYGAVIEWDEGKGKRGRGMLGVAGGDGGGNRREGESPQLQWFMQPSCQEWLGVKALWWRKWKERGFHKFPMKLISANLNKFHVSWALENHHLLFHGMHLNNLTAPHTPQTLTHWNNSSQLHTSS